MIGGQAQNYYSHYDQRQQASNISQALKTNTATYNAALEFINNPPSDCKITQICPPQRLTTKRAPTTIDIMKADYQVGIYCAEDFLRKSI